jgi:hypothetical protein
VELRQEQVGSVAGGFLVCLIGMVLNAYIQSKKS